MSASIHLPWLDFKASIVKNNLPVTYFNSQGNYYLYAFMQNFDLSCAISQTDPASSDQLDFETNFLLKATSII